jgi:repressor LexA
MVINATEALGPKIRRQRRRLGWTLDELALRSRISKPYLSLIENDRVNNPPSDEKLRKLEQCLGFATSELVSQAHWRRTPEDVRAMLVKMASDAPGEIGSQKEAAERMSVSQASVGCPDVTDTEAFALRVSDDDMMPKYRQGDIVIFSPALTARDGDDCLVSLIDGRMMFHRVFFEAEAVRLQPRNERRRPTVVSGDQIAVMHKAVYKYQRVDEE